ncbi:hypothetical protein Pcinc_015804 [Petrolisthes cinctipes]|uniref:mRNA-decapping enzyme 2 n=1 Tax=Petrolisthes cinctipes TaxID=88211 RepID=A0AAE1KMQ5_PETCI|nr:hypothetical protein Pcinc_015804 [Petrolisthes cinctipes]
MGPPSLNKNFIIPTDLLDDIASRFLLDAPESEIGNPIYLCFLTELAYWFYLDEYAEEDEKLNNLKFDAFAQQLLNRVGFQPASGTIEDMLQGFRDFKHRVPTFGGLLLNHDLSQVLLVQGFWHRASWGFPKGKINVDEEPHNCAIREVLEETGYDITSLLDPNLYLETSIGEQFVRLYIIPGVPTNTQFVPRTKGEIKQVKWFQINQLPAHKNDRTFSKANGSTNMFYMVMPFVKPIREWLANHHRNQNGGREGRRRHRSSGTGSSTDNYHHSHHQGYRHSHSPATTTDTAGKRPAPLTDSSRKQQSAAFASCIQEEAAGFEKLRGKPDSSPRRRETSSKGKARKALYNEHQEENTKFTFKSRGKGRSSKGQRENQPGASELNPTSGQQIIRSSSWQNFQINKKEVIDAVERVWSGVSLSW